MPPSWIDEADFDQLGEAASMALIIYTRLEEIVRLRVRAADSMAAISAGDEARARKALHAALEVASEVARLAQSLRELQEQAPGKP